MRRSINLLIAIIIIYSNNALSQWTECNTGLNGGVTSCFIFKDGYLFAGTSGGLYRSSDNGNNWVALRNGFPLKPVRSLIVVGPSLIAGTSGGGVYLTTDNGANWSASNTGLTNLSILSFHLKGIFLFAGTTNGGLFVSMNNGATWQPSNSGIPNAGVNNFIQIDDSVYAATGAGVYLTTNNGANWLARNSGLTSTNINSISYDGTILYAASQTNGVFISTDKGDNWSPSNNGISNLSILDIINNTTKVFAATNGGGVFYSVDGGLNWFPASNGLYNTYVQKLLLNGTALYAGTDGGAFYSTDEGTLWFDITNGLTNSLILKITNDENNNLYAGSYGRGVFKSTNNGISWFEINSGLEELYVNSLINNNNSLFAGLWNGQVCRSSDLGSTWSTVVIKTNPTSIVWSFALIGNNLFHGNSFNGVFISTNDGYSWTAANNGLTNTNVRCLAANGSNLFAGTSGGGIFLSTNNGGLWQAVNSGLINLNINSLVSNGAYIFAGTDGNGVFLSTNNGTNWQLISNGMGNQQVRSIVANGINLIAATNNGVYYSTNTGTSWQAANGGLLNLNDWTLEINGTEVFLGTYGNGTFKAPLSYFSGSVIPSITTGELPQFTCTGSTIDVPYTATGLFNNGNIFTAQLSDASGNFSFPVSIGSVNSTISGTINSVIPLSISSGSGYRIRVVGSNPTTIGTDNGLDITINLKPFPVINGMNTTCQNTSQTFSTLTTSGHSYVWSSDGGSIEGSNTQATVSINWGSLPSGTITLVETIDATGCKDSTYKIITLNPSPNPVISGFDTVCNKSRQTYSCSLVSGHTYLWSVNGGNISASNNNSVNIDWNTSNSFGTVSLIETIDATGCSTSISQDVSILKVPSPTISGIFNVCNESTLNYSTTFTAGNSYLWKVNGGNITGPNNQINVTVNWNTSQNSSTLTLIETNLTTLCLDSAVRIINIYPHPSPSFTGSNLSYSDSVEVYSTTPANGNYFNWHVTGGTIIGESNNIEARIRWQTPPSGTVTLIQTVDETDCKDSSYLVVTIKPFSPYFSGSLHVCENTIENYKASAINGCNYYWTVIGGNIIGDINSPSIQVQWLNIGNGSISLIMAIDSSGYKDSSSSIIAIHPLPSVPSISGTDISCVNKIENYSTIALPGFTYKWKAENGFIVSDENQPEVQVRWLYEPSGTITVYKTIMAGTCNSSNNQAVEVNIQPHPLITGPLSTINNAVEHYSVNYSPNSIYKWIVKGGTITGLDNLSEVDIQWGELNTGKLKIIETNTNQCTDSSEITVALYVSYVQDNSKKDVLLVKIIPNPINDKAIIQLTASESIKVNIQIINSLGNIVNEIADVQLDEGIQHIDLNSIDIKSELIHSGIYFFKLSGKFGVTVAKAVVVK